MSQAQPMSRRFLAELIGTFWLVFGGCGSAVLAAVFPYAQADANPLGLGFLGVSLALASPCSRWSMPLARSRAATSTRQ